MQTNARASKLIGGGAMHHQVGDLAFEVRQLAELAKLIGRWGISAPLHLIRPATD